MKKLSLFLIGLLLYVGVAMAGFENHPNLAQLNTFTASIIKTVIQSQADFFVEHGRYFQGLWLLGDNVQVDGTTDESVINISHPYDQEYTWKDFNPAIFKNNLKIPVNVKIDVYESPEGWGWVLRAELWLEGLGPDAYGFESNHWVYKHVEGPNQNILCDVCDKWYVQVD